MSDDLVFGMPMFYPVYAYQTVLELTFEDGVVKDEFDRSEKVAEIRQRIKEIRE